MRRAAIASIGGTAVVTGAAGGLGSAFVAALRARGCRTVGVDLSGADRVLDVTDARACRALAQELRPDIWINNAGILGAGRAADQPDAEIERLVAVNLLGTIHGTRAALAVMRPRGDGRILNVASLAAWVAVPGETVYAATKHAVRAFSVGLALELRGTGVSISILCPDGIWTPMLHDRLADPDAVMSFSGRRLLQAGEVAECGLRLLERRGLIASIPPARGAQTRLIGVAPSLTGRIYPLFRRIAERNQAALRRREADRL